MRDSSMNNTKLFKHILQHLIFCTLNTLLKGSSLLSFCFEQIHIPCFLGYITEPLSLKMCFCFVVFIHYVSWSYTDRSGLVHNRAELDHFPKDWNPYRGQPLVENIKWIEQIIFSAFVLRRHPADFSWGSVYETELDSDCESYLYYALFF